MDSHKTNTAVARNRHQNHHQPKRDLSSSFSKQDHRLSVVSPSSTMSASVAANKKTKVTAVVTPTPAPRAMVIMKGQPLTEATSIGNVLSNTKAPALLQQKSSWPSKTGSTSVPSLLSNSAPTSYPSDSPSYAPWDSSDSSSASYHQAAPSQCASSNDTADFVSSSPTRMAVVPEVALSSSSTPLRTSSKSTSKKSKCSKKGSSTAPNRRIASSPADQDESAVLISQSEVGEYDILCGRRKTSFNNVGNKHFRNTISQFLTEYLSISSKRAKTELIIKIVRHLRDEVGARFLKPTSKTIPPSTSSSNKRTKKTTASTADQFYVELLEREAREKVGHALRDLGKFSTMFNVIRYQTTKSTNTYIDIFSMELQPSQRIKSR